MSGADPMAELQSAVNQLEASRVCGRCQHWNRRAWKALKVVLASTTHGQRRLNEYRHRFLVATKNSLAIANMSDGGDDDFEVDDALDKLGVCQAMTLATNDPTVSHQTQRCPKFILDASTGVEDKSRPFDQFIARAGQPVPFPPAFMATMKAAIEAAKHEPPPTPPPPKAPPPKNLTEAFAAMVREKHNPSELARQFVEAIPTDSGLKAAWESSGPPDGRDPMKALFGPDLLAWLTDGPTNPIYATHFAAEVHLALHPPPARPKEDGKP